MSTKRKQLLTIATAGVVAGILTAGPARADLYIDFRLSDGTKTATVTSVGQAVTFNIYAIALGLDATSNEGMQTAGGSILSGVGGIKGSIGAPTASTFSGTSSQTATSAATDLDSDGDLDRGTFNSNSAPGFVVFRADSMQTGGTTVTYNGVAGNEYLLGTATFTVSELAAGTTINWRPRFNLNGTMTAGGASYRKDGSGSATATNGGIYSGGTSLVIHNTVVDGFTLTSAAANANLATGGSVTVTPTAAPGVYKSETDELTSDSNVGSVTVSNPVTPQASFVLWLSDTDAAGGSTIAATLADLQVAGGGTYNLLLDGNAAFEQINSQYGGEATAVVQFISPLPLDGAFNWNFSNTHGDIVMDRVALAPEPASIGLLGMVAGGLLARRRRKLD